MSFIQKSNRGPTRIFKWRVLRKKLIFYWCAGKDWSFWECRCCSCTWAWGTLKTSKSGRPPLQLCLNPSRTRQSNKGAFKLKVSKSAWSASCSPTPGSNKTAVEFHWNSLGISMFCFSFPTTGRNITIELKMISTHCTRTHGVHRPDSRSIRSFGFSPVCSHQKE